jgi:hypothetical protein
MKIYSIFIIGVLLSGCVSDDEILKKYNAKDKKELCNIMVKDTKLDMYTIQNFIENINENYRSKDIGRNNTEEEKAIIKNKIIGNLLKKDSISKVNEMICNKIDKTIDIKYYDDILSENTIKNKLLKLDEILDNETEDILKTTLMENIEEIKIIMKKED